MAVRDTVIELRIDESGSGILRVGRNGKDITNVSWAAEKVTGIVNLEEFTKGERETI
jgi:hypothetical protein